MSETPAVSVVIPLYNKGPYIARALNSVLAQTFQYFEVIVVDDGSTDEGASMVKDFEDSRIRLIQQENLGVSAARNKGIEASRAGLIAFLDADDEWMPDHLETLLKLYNMHPNAGAYATAWVTQTSSSSIKKANFHAIPAKPWEGLLPNYFRSAAFGDPPVCASAVGIPKRILAEMKGFTTKEWMGEDVDLWGRIALKYPIAFSWDGVVIYHTEATNRACNKVKPLAEAIFVRTAREALDAGKVPLTMQNDLQEYIARRQINRAWTNIQAKRPDLARTLLINCVTRRLIKEKYWALFWAHMPPRIYDLSSALRRIILDAMNMTREKSLNLTSSDAKLESKHLKF